MSIATTVFAEEPHEYTPLNHRIDAATLPHGFRRYAALELQRFMSELSQMQMCSGWYSGCEQILWSIMHGTCSLWVMSAEDIERLQILARDAGGWWFYDREEKKLKFVEMAEAEERMASE